MKTNLNIDEKLIEAYKTGDHKALPSLVKRWHKLFCEKAFWLVKEKDAAKDIAQDSWAVIIRKMDTLKDPKQFKYWAYRIVINKAMDWLRLQAKTQKHNVKYAIEISTHDEDYTEKEHLRFCVLKAINNLPESHKTVITLFYTQSYSLKEISNVLQISIGTAKSRLFYARENLKRVLKNVENKD